MGQRANRVAAGMIGVGAVALFVSLFLRWYPAIEGAYFDAAPGAPKGSSVFSATWMNAWEAFEWIDLLLLPLVVWKTVDEPGDVDFDRGFGVGIGAVVAAAALMALAAGGLVAALARD